MRSLIYLIFYDISIININSLTYKDFVLKVSANILTKGRYLSVALWIAHWTCNFGVRGSIPGVGVSHSSVLSVLSQAIFPGQIL